MSTAASFQSVPDMWRHRVGSTPESLAVKYRRGEGWEALTWEQADARVRAIANALLALGLRAEDRCAIVAETSVEWFLTDVAILCAGGATTTVFPQAPDADLTFVLDDSEARVVFVGTPAHAARLVRLRGALRHVEAVVVLHGEVREDDDWLVPLDRFERSGRDHASAHPQAYDEAQQSIQPDQMATLMYTSGATGTPRGVMLSHAAWIYEADAIDGLGALTPTDLQLLWLPLAHVLAKVLQLSFVRLGLPTAIDGRPGALLQNLAEVRPTFMAVVPATLERIQRALHEEARRRGPVAHRAFRWAVRIGRQHHQASRTGRPPLALELARLAADRIVGTQVRARFGGRLRFLISGGAALAPETGVFFESLGIPVLEGYGLTESGAASCVNRPGNVRYGTVGLPVPGCEVRIGHDGEIQIRSPGLMTGYWRDPEATRAAFTDDGFLRTGDIGHVLPSGHVQITGRQKEILVTSAGKNVAPSRVEQRLRAICRYVQDVVLIGDARPYCVALVTLDAETSRRWAFDHEIPFASMADLAAHPAVHRLIQTYVHRVNRTLAAFERIRRFDVLPEVFTEGNGLLTASAKIRRHLVARRFAARIDALYARPTDGVSAIAS